MVKHNNQLPKNHFVRSLPLSQEELCADFKVAQGLATPSKDLGSFFLSDFLSSYQYPSWADEVLQGSCARKKGLTRISGK